MATGYKLLTSCHGYRQHPTHQFGVQRYLLGCLGQNLPLLNCYSAGKPVERSPHPGLTASHSATVLRAFQPPICSLIAYRNKIFHPVFPNGQDWLGPEHMLREAHHWLHDLTPACPSIALYPAWLRFTKRISFPNILLTFHGVLKSNFNMSLWLTPKAVFYCFYSYAVQKLQAPTVYPIQGTDGAPKHPWGRLSYPIDKLSQGAATYRTTWNRTSLIHFCVRNSS